ncbi:MAG: UDP-N-acetylglucosamine 2-epimerase (hydrolyzing) [Flavobacteriales bacterium]|nr:UDP-N-acetylglucosamine 2-epimerase (hydrolyzing) [Flavobacteriales bacterium]
MRISVLTSSRADYGIYYPLLKQFQSDPYFDLNIIVFGTHLSKDYGFTLQNIIDDKFYVGYKVETLTAGDTAQDIAKSMALTMHKFGDIWEQENDKTDLILCLGDRYEMFAAVSASVPFNIPVAHIHGGEVTLGAIDNVFRHSLTLMSKYHFTSTTNHLEKVQNMIGQKDNVYSVGSLSLDNLHEIKLLNLAEFKLKFNIDLSKKTLLVTFHPETVSFQENADYVKELVEVFKTIEGFQVLITMPNSDTMGSVIRKAFKELDKESDYVIIVENFGLHGYFSAMKHCKFLLGNTSSGIIEAASFNKYVINIGNRQKGRTAGGNIIDVHIQKEAILRKIEHVDKLGEYTGINIYKGQKLASSQILKTLRNI